MIPIDDGKPTKHAFIMYNPEDRVGAHGEAESLGASLQVRKTIAHRLKLQRTHRQEIPYGIV